MIKLHLTGIDITVRGKIIETTPKSALPDIARLARKWPQVSGQYSEEQKIAFVLLEFGATIERPPKFPKGAIF